MENSTQKTSLEKTDKSPENTNKKYKCPECKREVTEDKWEDGLLQQSCYNCFWGYTYEEDKITEDF